MAQLRFMKKSDLKGNQKNFGYLFGYLFKPHIYVDL